MLLLLMTSLDWKLKSKIPIKAQELAVTVVALMTMLVEPFKLPIVFPVVPPTLNKPAEAPTEIPMNPEPLLVVPVEVVWLKPEMILF